MYHFPPPAEMNPYLTESFQVDSPLSSTSMLATKSRPFHDSPLPWDADLLDFSSTSDGSISHVLLRNSLLFSLKNLKNTALIGTL